MIKEIMPEFCVGATNVYRTRYYIVKQCMGIKYDLSENSVVFSHDTFYLRTKRRDLEYEGFFAERKNVNGRRMKSAMYERKYVF